VARRVAYIDKALGTLLKTVSVPRGVGTGGAGSVAAPPTFGAGEQCSPKFVDVTDWRWLLLLFGIDNQQNPRDVGTVYTAYTVEHMHDVRENQTWTTEVSDGAP